MALNFHVITPCGGHYGAVRETVESVAATAAAHPSIQFDHYLVFNNGLVSSADIERSSHNYAQFVSDLGVVPSRAQARNLALDSLAEKASPTEIGNSMVCFLDAGDVIVDSGALLTSFEGIAQRPRPTIWAFAAHISGADIESVRRPRPLWLRHINNPFLIGATYPTTDVALRARFSEGAKEDWKYWLDLLATSPHVERRSDIAYEYRVISTTDHVQRKGRLVRHQYRFFAEYLGYGHGVRTFVSVLMHVLIAGVSWLRRSTRWRPSGSRSSGSRWSGSRWSGSRSAASLSAGTRSAGTRSAGLRSSGSRSK